MIVCPRDNLIFATKFFLIESSITIFLKRDGLIFAISTAREIYLMFIPNRGISYPKLEEPVHFV